MGAKLKLGFYMYTPEIGGAEQQLRDLLWLLDRDRYEITLFYEPWPVFEQFLGLNACPKLTLQPISVYEVSQFLRNSVSMSKNSRRIRYYFNYYFWQYRWTRSNYYRLKSAFSAVPIDVLHISNGGYPGAATAQWASVAAKATGIPACLMTIHGVPTGYRFPHILQKWIDHQVKLATDWFVTVSDCVGQVLRQKRDFPASKIKTIYNGITPAPLNPVQIDKALVRQKFSLLSNSTVIGIVARLSPGKGHTQLLEAIANLRDRLNETIEVLVMGSGILLETLKSYSIELGLERLVKFTGYLPHSELLEGMAICDIITLPSLAAESFGYANVEAMSLAKPVVSTTIGGIPEIVVDGQTGLLVPPGDSVALANALLHLINHPELRQQIGERGYSRYKSLFTIERMLQEYEAIYQTLLSRKDEFTFSSSK